MRECHFKLLVKKENFFLKLERKSCKFWWISLFVSLFILKAHKYCQRVSPKYFAVVVSDVDGCRDFKLVKQLELSHLTPPHPLQSLLWRYQLFKGMCGCGVGEALSNKNLKLFTKRLKFWRSTVKMIPRPFLSKKLTVFDDTGCPTSTLNQNTPDTQAEKKHD